MGDSFDEFLARYPADVAVIDHLKQRCQRNFFDSPDWRLAFYGPTAAVFLRGGADSAPRHGGLDRLRNANNALHVFEVAIAADDYDVAWNVLTQMEARPLRRQLAAAHLDARARYRDAYRTLGRRDFEEARSLLLEALRVRSPSDRDRRVQVLLDQRQGALAAGLAADASAIEDRLAVLGASG
jgi:hypothetical protein